MNNIKLNDEEQALLDSLEAGEWQSVPDLENEIAKHVQYAKNTIKKVSGLISVSLPEIWQGFRRSRWKMAFLTRRLCPAFSISSLRASWLKDKERDHVNTSSIVLLVK